MKERVSIVIPSRGIHPESLYGILDSLEKQTFQGFKILIVLDRDMSKEDYTLFVQEIEKKGFQVFGKITFLSNVTSGFNPRHRGGASYVRNMGIQHADTELVQLFDDDNIFDEAYLQTAVNYYDEWRGKEKNSVIITPTLMRRDTQRIQNQGFSRYLYWQARPQVNYLKHGQKVGRIQMFSGNGVLGETKLFQRVKYDEQIAWISEDLDFTYSLSKYGCPILVFADLIIKHMERDKTKLEEAWIGSEAQAKQKSRNRFLWVKKHATPWEKIKFYSYGVRGNSTWLSAKALLYGGKGRWKIVRGIWGGMFPKVNLNGR